MDATEWLDGIPTLDLNHSDPREVVRFGILKRRFYFEHAQGHTVFALQRDHDRDFSRVLQGAETADEVFKGQRLRAINHAYCPSPFTGCERELYLWFSHRYHEQPTRSYVASRSIPSASFSIRLPRLPARIESAFDYQADHMVLECQAGDHRVGLRIDASLHTTLEQLAAGFPRHLAPESELNKLDDYLSRPLRLDVPNTRQFVIYSAEARWVTDLNRSDYLPKCAEIESLAA